MSEFGLQKILSVDQIRAADQYTIEHLPISSIDLMEKASRAFVSGFLQEFGANKTIKVFCGIGNNGGDGLAISRLLNGFGGKVSVYCIGNKEKSSEDFRINLERLDGQLEVFWLSKKSDFPNIEKSDIIIDGLFGSGLTRVVEGLYADLILWINDSEHEQVLSIDIPSGLLGDEHTPSENIIRSDHTISFQVPKLAFFMPQNHQYNGELSIVDIGLDQGFINRQDTPNHLVTQTYVNSILKKRKIFDHKGSYGKNLIIAGSKGKMGAAVLASRACMRSGAGLVTNYSPGCGYHILQIAVPETMVLTDNHEELITDIPDTQIYDSIGIGPGIGTEDMTSEALIKLFDNFQRPIVIDADAINIIARDNLISSIPEGSILTPHPGEFKRLVGGWKNDFDRLEKQKSLSSQYKLVILLKGAFSSISNEDGKVFINSTGNPGMATGGSGDVLTGIITALLGQGYSSTNATILGAYLHGLAGNLFVKDYSEEGLIAGDLIEYLPKAFEQV